MSLLVKSTQSNEGHRSREYVLAVTQTCFSAELVTEHFTCLASRSVCGPYEGKD